MKHAFTLKSSAICAALFGATSVPAAPEVTIGRDPECFQTFYVQELGNQLIRQPVGSPVEKNTGRPIALSYKRAKEARFSHQSILEVQIAPGPLSKAQYSDVTMTMRDFDMTERKANGEFGFTIDVTRLLKAQIIDGSPAFVFDTGYEEHVQTALSDPDYPPEIKASLANLDLKYKVWLTPAGELRDFQIDHPDPDVRDSLASLAENDIAGGFLKLPDQEVAIGERWPAGAKTMNIPNVGSISLDLEGELTAVYDVDGLGEVAIIELEPASSTFENAMASNFEVTAIDAKFNYLYAFAPSFGAIIYQHAIASISAETTIDGNSEVLEICVVNGSMEIKEGSYSSTGQSDPRPYLVVIKHPQTMEPLLFLGK